MQGHRRMQGKGDTPHGKSREIQRSALTAASIVPTIFHEPWWLESACNGDYREVKLEVGGRLVGRLPYRQSTVAGQTILKMPLLTHVLGPAISTHAGPASRISREVDITTRLISQLPRAAHVSFRLHGGTSNTLAFEAAGFITGTQFTIEVPPVPYDQQWRQMRDKTRNSVRRAQDHLGVVELTEAADFLDFYETNLILRNRTNFYERLNTERVISQSFARGAGRILAAVDKAGRYQAAIFTVWDQRSEYYFMSTRRVGCMNGATSVLIWHAIQHAAQRGLCFDMDGIHVLGERMPNLLFLSGFGGAIVPRYTVRRSSVLLKVLNRMHGLARRPWLRV